MRKWLVMVVGVLRVVVNVLLLMVGVLALLGVVCVVKSILVLKNWRSIANGARK